MMDKASHSNFYITFVTRYLILNKGLEYHQYESGIDVMGNLTASWLYLTCFLLKNIVEAWYSRIGTHKAIAKFIAIIFATWEQIKTALNFFISMSIC